MTLVILRVILTLNEENKFRMKVKTLEEEKDMKLRQMEKELVKEREARKQFEQDIIEMIRQKGNRGEGMPVINPEQEQ